MCIGDRNQFDQLISILSTIMCITFFSLKPQSGKQKNIQFVMAFNRDEQSKRKTSLLQAFQQDPNIYAGRDAISGGTWTGINIKTGIIVLLTNYVVQLKKPTTKKNKTKSRGKLVMSFLNTDNYDNLTAQQENTKIYESLVQVLKERKLYSACNIVIYLPQTESLYYICTETDMKQPLVLSKGQSYGLSNSSLDVVWPKTKYGLQKFKQLIENLQKYDSHSQIFKELSKIMTDNKSFHQDPQYQESVFIQPYFSEIQQAQRKTKCTLYAIVQRKQIGFEIHMKETTYDENQDKINTQYVKAFGKSSHI